LGTGKIVLEKKGRAKWDAAGEKSALYAGVSDEVQFKRSLTQATEEGKRSTRGAWSQCDVKRRIERTSAVEPVSGFFREDRDTRAENVDGEG